MCIHWGLYLARHLMEEACGISENTRIPPSCLDKTVFLMVLEHSWEWLRRRLNEAWFDDCCIKDPDTREPIGIDWTKGSPWKFQDVRLT